MERPPSADVVLPELIPLVTRPEECEGREVESSSNQRAGNKISIQTPAPVEELVPLVNSNAGSGFNKPNTSSPNQRAPNTSTKRRSSRISKRQESYKHPKRAKIFVDSTPKPQPTPRPRPTPTTHPSWMGLNELTRNKLSDPFNVDDGRGNSDTLGDELRDEMMYNEPAHHVDFNRTFSDEFLKLFEKGSI